MGGPVSARARQRAYRDLTRRAGEELNAARLDLGWSQSELSRRSGVDQAVISRLEAGLATPSCASLVALSEAMGGRLTIRFYPGTGPRIRDFLQAPIAESLIRRLHPRWRPIPEVPVYAPVRGVVDVVLVDRLAPMAISTEVQSELRRLEQQLRWAAQKSDALPSSRLWAELPSATQVARLMVLRSTRATRTVARAHSATLAAAHPAKTADALASLFEGRAWPGNSLIWCELDRGTGRILDGVPRGIAVGR